MDGAQIIVGELAPGSYSSKELVPVGWVLTSIVCDDDKSSGDTASATASFVLISGDTTTCVFNEHPARREHRRHQDPDAHQSA